MTGLRTEQLLDLVRGASSPCVSLYLPTHRTGREVHQDPTRLKNLLRDARAQCAALGFHNGTADAVLAPADAMIADEEFWDHHGEGLALLLAPGKQLTRDLPYACREQALVADRFHVKPLLPLLESGTSYLVLALSQNAVRLFRGTRDGLTELEASGLPKSLADALWMDDPEKSLQLHTTGSRRGGEAMFHGQGAGEEDAKNALARYFRAVDHALHAYVGDKPVPLVLACVDYYRPIYRSVSSYPHLVGEVAAGNPDAVPRDVLHARTWKILEQRNAERRRAVAERFADAEGAGRAVRDLGEVVLAAQNARVADLLVAIDRHRWGRPSADGVEAPVVRDDRARRETADVDLVDYAALATLENGGTVHPRLCADMPENCEVAAVLRY